MSGKSLHSIEAQCDGAVLQQNYSLRHAVLDEGINNHVDHFDADQTWFSPMGWRRL